ncbi:acyltransferase [Lysobacter sp. 5GHs7-4]|uniref:acyltransferase family protein n=1 Tax=Lysobacter sp. 5GHs7-4 TaxID=2904253 RepID=UPI001E48E7F7|nr:acyltransferase [Lysobacter sp. 5GHs7-4]UHQ24641.1 acyltransferase [Lysobacter sp. 5GHs7-4]
MTPRTLAEGHAQPRNNFNLIRLVAAWLVIYGHSYAVTASGGQDLLLQLVQIKFAGGIAVDMFFVISGFLIAASLERNRLAGYVAARALRIFPALIVCVALSVLVLGPWLTTAADYWSSPQTWKYLRANALLSRDTQYFLPGVFETLPSHAINGSLWSLPIEVRLYLWLALIGLLRLLPRLRFNLLCVALLIFGVVKYGGQTLSPEKINWLYCTAYFLTGSLAWVNRDRVPLRWWLLALVLVAAALLRGSSYYYLGYFVALSYTTLFLAFVPRLPQIRRTDLSYGLYLYGWPAQQLVQHYAPSTGPLMNTLWATLIAGTLAALSWHLVERPALRLKSRFGARNDPHAPAAAEPAGGGAVAANAPRE